MILENNLTSHKQNFKAFILRSTGGIWKAKLGVCYVLWIETMECTSEIYWAAISYWFMFLLIQLRSCVTFELMYLQERPAFMLPYVILGMIGLIICAVAVVIIGIFFFVENIIIAGVVVLILGGLTMGKNYKW